MAIEAALITAVANQGGKPGPKAPQKKVEIAEKSNTAAMAKSEKRVADTNAAAEKDEGSPIRIQEENMLPQAGTESLKKALEELNKNVHNSEIAFGIHDATHRVTIKIIDKDTKKVLKEYPPEKTLDMIAKVWEMAGLMVDEKG